jgi:hypothetical protein
VSKSGRSAQRQQLRFFGEVKLVELRLSEVDLGLAASDLDKLEPITGGQRRRQE